jgi:hypothetical protein
MISVLTMTTHLLDEFQYASTLWDKGEESFR